MSNSLSFYQDSGLTIPFSLLSATQADDGSSSAVDRVAYLGSTVAAKKFENAATPGTGQIVLSISDTLTGLQIPAASIRLALSLGGLDSATPGAAINLGTTILSGPGNALAVHVRIDADAIGAGSYDNLSLVTSNTMESAA